MPVDQQTSPMCQAALAYARRGWAVFPCSNETKRPLLPRETDAGGKPIKGTGGLTKATTDETQILAWWKRWPNAMIGLPAGAEWFVLDFDPRTDPDTGEVWTLDRLKRQLEEQMGCPLPRSLTGMTQSDGVHVYFRQPAGEPIRNRGNLPDHVDVRGVGGYVIAPPSVMASGARYRWLDRGDWRDPAALIEAPAELVAILRERGKAKGAAAAEPSRRQAASPTRNVEGAVDDDVRKYAMVAVEAECREIREAPSGRRNPQLNTSAFKVATLVAAGAIDAGFARAAVEAAARDNAGRDDDGQLAATIDSGWTAGIEQPRDLREIAAASRSRRERGPPRATSRPSPPAPSSTDDGKPSSQAGGRRQHVQEGAGGEEAARECAFLPQTDLGNLERFLCRHGRDFLFVEQWGWLAWDGKRWNRDMAMSLLGRAIQDTMRAVQEEAALVKSTGVPEEALPIYDAEQKRAHDEQQKGKLDRVVKVARDGTVTLLSDTISKWGRTSEGAGHISALFKMLEARLWARTSEFDVDPLLVNMANGTLVFARSENGQGATVRRVDHRREDRITKIGSASYVPTANCPTYDAFLGRVQPDTDMRDFLDVWAGYNMLGDASAQKMAIFYGEGANGKGVWINTKRAILGDYAWAASIDTFVAGDRGRKGSDASPDLAALAGRRMVYANEAEEGSRLSDALVKELTSDEPKNVRELLKSPFEMMITFKNTIIANNKPRIGTDHGIRRRMQLVPWGVIIPDEEQDVQLKAKLVAEASGILNRMVKGALAYLSSGIPLPEAVREATQEYLDENDILGKFLDLCIERVPGETIGSSALHDLFAAWQTWAQLLPASGKPWSPKYLASQLERKGFKKRKSSSMIWDDLWPKYDASDFTRDGKPVTDELPAPHMRGGTGPTGQSRGDYRDDIPA